MIVLIQDRFKIIESALSVKIGQAVEVIYMTSNNFKKMNFFLDKC